MVYTNAADCMLVFPKINWHLELESLGVIRSWGGGKSLLVLLQEEGKDSPFLSELSAICKAGSEPHQMLHTGNSILDCPASRTGRNRRLVLKQFTVCNVAKLW